MKRNTPEHISYLMIRPGIEPKPTFSVADQGEGPGAPGAPSPPIFLAQTEARRAENIFFLRPDPPLTQGLDDRPLPPPPPHPSLELNQLSKSVGKIKANNLIWRLSSWLTLLPFRLVLTVTLSPNGLPSNGLASFGLMTWIGAF